MTSTAISSSSEAGKRVVAKGQAPVSVGRPRHSGPTAKRVGVSGRDEILDAAAQLFVEKGYAATSTRMIAMAVGVKQSSLYYHFANKEDILAGLLPGTVGPSLAFSRLLAKSGEPAHVQLYALTRYDVSLLCTSRWNLAALYGLPELRSDRFAEFRRDRYRLSDAYARRVTAGVREEIFTVESIPMAAALVFALAESVISMRSDGKIVDPVKFPAATGAGVLRLLNCPAVELAEAADRYSALAVSAPPLTQSTSRPPGL